jgi:hypothetical protein
MFTKSPGDVVAKTRKGVGVKQTMVTIFFTDKQFLIAGGLPKGQKYNHNYFISDIYPELEQEQKGQKRNKRDGTFYVQMDHSKSPDGGKNQAKFETKGLVRSSRPPYSPSRSPCDFWFFGMAKRKMKDQESHTVQNILGRLTEI